MSLQHLFKRTTTSVIEDKERIYVKVHYQDRERAKELGAKWDYRKKQYYVEYDEDEFYDKLKGYKKYVKGSKSEKKMTEAKTTDEGDEKERPYPNNREVWIDGKLIARNDELVADYLSYLPEPLYKNPCMAYMTPEQEDNYRYQLDRYNHPNVYKHI